MNNVIEFPLDRIKKAKEEKETRLGAASKIEIVDSMQFNVAADGIDQFVKILLECGYDPLSSKAMIDDLAVIINCTYAMLLRHDGEYHILQDFLDDTKISLVELQKMMDHHNELFNKPEDDT